MPVSLKKQLLLLCLIVSFIPKGNAQFDTSYMQRNIRICADSMMVGFKNYDWELFTRYSYPPLVASMGGRDGFRKYISDMFSQIPKTAWKKYETARILQVVKAGRDYQATIELHSVIEFNGFRVTSNSYLIGESWDGGLFWTFFDSQGDAAASKQLNPNLSPELVIPKPYLKEEPLNELKKNK